MTPTLDSKSRYPHISSTTKVATIMVPVPNASIVVTVCSSSTKSVDN